MESIRDLLRKLFEEVKTENANMSLDEILYEVYSNNFLNKSLIDSILSNTYFLYYFF